MAPTSARRVGAVATVATLLLSAALADAARAPQGQLPHIGTWTLNVAKSRYGPGAMPRASTITYETAGAGVKVTSVTVASDGSTSQSVYTTNYDGQDCPVTSTSGGADFTAVTRVDARTFKRVNKSGGKVTTVQTAVVSRDGKTLTIVSKGTSATGLIVDSTAVYNRQ
jgi:hypothetical protein